MMVLHGVQHAHNKDCKAYAQNMHAAHPDLNPFTWREARLYTSVCRYKPGASFHWLRLILHLLSSGMSAQKRTGSLVKSLQGAALPRVCKLQPYSVLPWQQTKTAQSFPRDGCTLFRVISYLQQTYCAKKEGSPYGRSIECCAS